MKRLTNLLTLFALFAVALIVTGCDGGESDAKRVLADQGFTNVQTESRWFGCSDNDLHTIGFKATSQIGKPVSGVVCGGFGKGWTVRFD